jgi:hypothetical protein
MPLSHKCENTKKSAEPNSPEEKMTYAQILQKYSGQIYEDFYPYQAKAICPAVFIGRREGQFSWFRRFEGRNVAIFAGQIYAIFCPHTINSVILVLLHPAAKKKYS